MKHVFIINPVAGSHDQTKETEEAIKAVLGDEAVVHVTKAHLDAFEFVKQWLATSSEAVRFYACGGDGTLNEVAHAAMNHENASVACYPIGSGNDFIKVYGTATDFRDLKALVAAEDQVIDLLKIKDARGTQDEISINVVNLGFDSQVVANMALYKGKCSGEKAYRKGVLKAFFSHFGFDGTFSVNGSLFHTTPFMLASFANGTTYGGGYKTAPLADPADGSLEFCLVDKLSRLSFVQMLGDYKAGKHLSSSRKVFKTHIHYARAQEVSVSLRAPLTVSIDGELFDYQDFTVSVLAHALRFAVPVNCSEGGNHE